MAGAALSIPLLILAPSFPSRRANTVRLIRVEPISRPYGTHRLVAFARNFGTPFSIPVPTLANKPSGVKPSKPEHVYPHQKSHKGFSNNSRRNNKRRKVDDHDYEQKHNVNTNNTTSSSTSSSIVEEADDLFSNQLGYDGSDKMTYYRKRSGPMFKDLAGMDDMIEKLKENVIVPLCHPYMLQPGEDPTSGILLHGPPGCGKTKLAHAIANETRLPFYNVAAPELVSGVSGASEKNIRELFTEAYKTAPSIVFIDEIDTIASKKENLHKETDRRIVTQLMMCMDGSHRLVKYGGENADSDCSDDENCDEDDSEENSDCRRASGHVLVIGATNRPDAIDPALRRPGRFDREICLGVLDESARVEILSVLTSKLKVEGAIDLVKIAKSTPGFVGADLKALAKEACNLARKRVVDKRKVEFSEKEDWWRPPWSRDEVERLSISMADLEVAATMVQPSSKREGFSTIPDVKWDDVGGLDFLRREFDRSIIKRIKFPKDYEDFGVDLKTGFLLYGPPGCGKTLIAKAVANEGGANFIYIKGPELLNKYVGESELAVRTIFSRARTCSPCILFFDEVDALTTNRGNEDGSVVQRIMKQLLVEPDGAEERRGVYVIGATNRPEVIDRALLRPGRFEKRVYVPLPRPEERGMILNALARKRPIDATVDPMAIGKDNACSNLSGADLNALMNEAAMAAVEEKHRSSHRSTDGTIWTIKDEHFKRALEKISPSVSNEQIQLYELFSETFSCMKPETVL